MVHSIGTVIRTRRRAERADRAESRLDPEAFSNSPPYWMTEAAGTLHPGSASGGKQPEKRCLRAVRSLSDRGREALRGQRRGITSNARAPERAECQLVEVEWVDRGVTSRPRTRNASSGAVQRSASVGEGSTETAVSAADENSIDDAVANLQLRPAPPRPPSVRSMFSLHSGAAQTAARARDEAREAALAIRIRLAQRGGGGRDRGGSSSWGDASWPT